MQASTKLRVLSGSHLNKTKADKITTVEFSEYQYFVGHPFLIHGGYKGIEYNVRLHFYNGFPVTQSNVTDLVRDIHPFYFNPKKHLQNMSKKSALKRKQRMSPYGQRNSLFPSRRKHVVLPAMKDVGEVSKEQLVATSAVEKMRVRNHRQNIMSIKGSHISSYSKIKACRRPDMTIKQSRRYHTRRSKSI